MSQLQPPEPYLSPKELAAEIKARYKLTVSANYVRAMLRAGVRRIGYSARLSSVMEWWEKNPDFAPRKKPRSSV
jgi:hypothetical protein